MKKQNHTHKLRRHTYKSGNSVFFCTLPECNFKIDAALSLGKTTVCNRCGKDFNLDEYSIRAAKPCCTSCRKKRVLVEGTVKYVRPIEIVTSSIAEQKVDDLKSRLSGLVTSINNPSEDI